MVRMHMNDYDEFIKYDLIIQSITMGEINGKAASNLLKAVRNGVGIAGTHGGSVIHLEIILDINL